MGMYQSAHSVKHLLVGVCVCKSVSVCVCITVREIAGETDNWLTLKETDWWETENHFVMLRCKIMSYVWFDDNVSHKTEEFLQSSLLLWSTLPIKRIHQNSTTPWWSHYLSYITPLPVHLFQNNQQELLKLHSTRPPIWTITQVDSSCFYKQRSL